MAENDHSVDITTAVSIDKWVAGVVENITHVHGIVTAENYGCIPCRVGTVRQRESLVRLASPAGDRRAELEILDQLDGALRDGSVCGLGQAASAAVQSAISLGLIGAER